MFSYTSTLSLVGIIISFSGVLTVALVYQSLIWLDDRPASLRFNTEISRLLPIMPWDYRRRARVILF
jgi:hypothetical protein